MFSAADGVLGVLLPALIVLVVAGLAAWFARGDARPSSRRWAGAALALAAGLGCAAGIAGVLRRVPGFPPSEAAEWVFYAVLAASIAEAIVIAFAAPTWVGALVVCAVAVCALRVALKSQFAQSGDDEGWSPAQGMLYVIGMGVIATAMWWALRRACDDLRHLAPLAAWGVAALAAVLLMVTGSQELGQLAGAVAAVAGAELVLKLLPKRWTGGIHGITAAAVPAVGLTLLLAVGTRLSSTGIGFVIAFAAAPVLLWVAMLLPVSGWRPWQRLLLRAAILAIPLMAATGIAVAQFARHQNDTNVDAGE